MRGAGRNQGRALANRRDQFRVDARDRSALRVRTAHAAARDGAARHLSVTRGLHRGDVFSECGSRGEGSAERKNQNHAQTEMEEGLHKADSRPGATSIL